MIGQVSPTIIIPIIPHSFKAVLDKEPGPGKKDHSFFAIVDVDVEIDWKVELVEAHPPGTNPLDKLLRFEVHRPSGVHGDAIAKRTLRYEEAHAKAEYTHATIEDGQDSQAIKVAIVV